MLYCIIISVLDHTFIEDGPRVLPTHSLTYSFLFYSIKYLFTSQIVLGISSMYWVYNYEKKKKLILLNCLEVLYKNYSNEQFKKLTIEHNK